jgi:Putative Ig domain
MRIRKAIKSLLALPWSSQAYAGTPALGAAVCCTLLLLALSGCGSVQTTASRGTSSTPDAITDPPPVISGFPPTSAQVGVQYDYAPAVSDGLSTALTFDITNMPGWATFNTATGELKGSPGADDIGITNEIEIGVSDGVGRTTVGPFRITIAAAPPTTPPDAPPTISGTPPANVVDGQTYLFAPSASDPNGNALTFLIVNRPSWASFSTSTGQLSGVPTAASVGSYANITISVSNGTLTASLPAFTIMVSTPLVNGPPTIDGTPTTSVNAGSGYSFTPSASDPAGNPLTFSIQNLPGWAAFNAGNGRLSGTPASADIGSYPNIVISVSDGTLTASLPAFTLTVTATGTGPPTISGTPATSVNVGSAYSFTPSASDPAGNPLTFSIQNLPGWAAFNAASGRVSGTPTSANIGSYPNIIISVSDGTLSASLPAFTLSVTAPVDGPPTISGTPATSVNVGSAYSFTPKASDPQGHALAFSIENQPAWASFNPSTGQLSGTPVVANVGSYANITISVSNGTLSASLPAFNIAVTQISTGTVTVNWSIPTQNTNGTPLVNLAGFRVLFGTSADNLTQSDQIANPGVTSYVLSNLAPGTWYIALVDYTTSGAQSNLSNIASTTVR